MVFLIKLTLQDLNNLKVFLDRVNMTGAEVSAYVRILNAVQTAKQEEIEKETATKEG